MWPIGAAVPAGTLLPSSSSGPQRDILPLMIPRHHPFSNSLPAKRPLGTHLGFKVVENVAWAMKEVQYCLEDLLVQIQSCFSNTKNYSPLCVLSHSLSPPMEENVPAHTGAG